MCSFHTLHKTERKEDPELYRREVHDHSDPLLRCVRDDSDQEKNLPLSMALQLVHPKVRASFRKLKGNRQGQNLGNHETTNQQ